MQCAEFSINIEEVGSAKYRNIITCYCSRSVIYTFITAA